jgi:signal transduction histidine kinase
MEALLDEFQDIARLRSGNPLELRITPTDLVALAEVAARDAAATTSLHRVLVTANEPSLVGRWDPLRLRRVLDNLLGNAIKYSPDGGDVTVAVGLTERDGDSWAVLTVCDQGVGIPKADLPHIFERYRRGSNVGERVAGAGIGLAGAFQIVQQHGGVIDVESEEGRGSLFTLALPLQNLIPPFRSSVRPDSGSLA